MVTVVSLVAIEQLKVGELIEQVPELPNESSMMIWLGLGPVPVKLPVTV